METSFVGTQSPLRESITAKCVSVGAIRLAIVCCCDRTTLVVLVIIYLLKAVIVKTLGACGDYPWIRPPTHCNEFRNSKRIDPSFTTELRFSTAMQTLLSFPVSPFAEPTA